MCKTQNHRNTSCVRVLFLGNSATYVHDLPGTLGRLARQAGYCLECDSIAKPSITASFHADAATEHGQTVLQTIQKGYDIVFLQDNGNCVENDEKREACISACDLLSSKAIASGAKLFYYVRPPYGYEAFGRTPIEQCRAFDELFTGIANKNGAVCAYVNRAFEYAIKNTDIRLWGDDNAHTSEAGAYLAVCVHFAAIYGKSATILDENGIEKAKELQQIADKVVFGG